MKNGVLAFLLFAAAATMPADAGPRSDVLAKCLLRSASEDDQIQLMRWMFSVLSLHPDIRDLAAVSDEARDEITATAAALFQRLMTVDCRTEVVESLRYEGLLAFQNSFKTLGEMAARGLLSAPDVGKAMSGLGEKFDKEKLAELMKEASTPPQ